MTMWDPTAKRPEHVVEIESSRDEDGRAQGTVTVRGWGAAEHLAYQDRSMDAVKLDISEDGAKMRRVIPSKLTLLHLALSIVDSTGFPDVGGRRFDWSDPEHVASLDWSVVQEVHEHVQRLTPLPSAAVKRPADRKARTVTAEPDEDLDPGDEQDPSPARSKSPKRPRR